MKPAKTALIVSAIVGALLFLVVAFLLVRSIQSYNEGNHTYRSERSKLEKYLKKAPFPSQENVDLEVGNAGQIDSWFDDVITRLMAGNIQGRTQRSPSKFVSVYGAMQSKLNEYARNQTVGVADNFTYGFDFYSGTGTLPAPDDVPRLMAQLEMVTRLSRILFDARVKQLVEIQRPVFESAAKASLSPGSVSGTTRQSRSEDTARPSRSSRRRKPSSKRPSKGAPTAASRAASRAEVARGLFKTERFVFTFKAKESALMEALNSLATIREFVVVHAVTLTKPVPALVPDANNPTASGASPSDAVDPLAMLGLAAQPGAPAGTGPAPPPTEEKAHFVSGPLFEIPLDVTLELDVYTFLRKET